MYMELVICLSTSTRKEEDCKGTMNATKKITSFTQ